MTKKPKESLVDWVIRTTPPKPTPPARPNKLEQQAPPGTAARPRYVPLAEWAQLLLGDHAPHYNTLLRWVHEGRIQPAPKKIGRRWYVVPAAEYVPD